MSLFFVFIIGILKSIASSAGRPRDFLKKFGRVGSAYLLAWPITVLLCEMFLPNYMHHEIITFVEEATHLSTAVYIIYMISYPYTSYRKVSKKD